MRATRFWHGAHYRSVLELTRKGGALKRAGRWKVVKKTQRGGQVFFCVRFALARYDTLVTTTDEFDYIARFFDKHRLHFHGIA